MKIGFNEANDRFCKDHTVDEGSGTVREIRI